MLTGVGVRYRSARKSKWKSRLIYKLNQGWRSFWMSISVREKLKF
jgi:hypothetical protein